MNASPPRTVAEPPHVDPLPPEAYSRMTLTLRAGLGLAIAILLAGLVAYILVYPSSTSGTVLSANPILNYLNLSGLVTGLATGTVEAYLTLGLVILVVTPILRVVTGCYYFQRAGERAMTGITLAVLALLLLGLLVIGPHVR